MVGLLISAFVLSLCAVFQAEPTVELDETRPVVREPWMNMDATVNKETLRSFQVGIVTKVMKNPGIPEVRPCVRVCMRCRPCALFMCVCLCVCMPYQSCAAALFMCVCLCVCMPCSRVLLDVRARVRACHAGHGAVFELPARMSKGFWCRVAKLLIPHHLDYLPRHSRPSSRASTAWRTRELSATSWPRYGCAMTLLSH